MQEKVKHPAHSPLDCRCNIANTQMPAQHAELRPVVPSGLSLTHGCLYMDTLASA